VDVSDVPRLVELSKIIYKEEDLIRISTFVENKQYIAKIVEGFSDDRMDKIITIAYQHDMQQEVISVFSHLSNKEMQRVLKIVSQLPINLKTTVLKDFEERIK
jgi:Lhr-like helicase